MKPKAWIGRFAHILLDPSGETGWRNVAAMAFWRSVARIREQPRPVGQPRYSDTPIDPNRYTSAFFKEHLQYAILPFWRDHGWDAQNGGFFSHLDRQGRPLSADKLSIVHASTIYGCTVGFEMTGNLAYRHLADQGVDYLLTRLWDKQYGGCFNLVDPTGSVLQDDKHIYDQAYVLLGLIAYARLAGDAVVWDVIHQLLELIETRLCANGGYAMIACRDWKISNPARNISAMTNMLGIMQMLAECTGVRHYLERAVAIAGIIHERMRDLHLGCVREVFTPAWVYQPVASHDRVEIGHNLKVARQFFQLSNLTGDPTWDEAGFGYLAYARRFGWDTAHGGFFQSTFRTGELAGSQKSTWVQCNGLLALWLASKLRQNPHDQGDFLRQADFIFNYLADHEFGEWFRACSANGAPLLTDKAGRTKSAFYTTYTCTELARGMTS